MFKTLLAKSLSPDEAINDRARGAAKYTGHISCVMQAADVLVEELGLRILQQLGLDKTIQFEHFANTVRLGAYLHDWGKANQHFQEMVYLKTIDPSDPTLAAWRKQILNSSHEHFDRQMLRHEVISGILALYVPTFRKWLRQSPNSDLIIAVWAAMGHHLKIGVGPNKQPSGEIALIPYSTGDELIIYTHHSDFRSVLSMGSQSLGLPKQLPDLPPEKWSKDELCKALTVLRDKFVELENGLNWEQKKFAAAVKATVIAADLAGSALPQAEEDFKDWMREVLHLALTQTELQTLVDQKLDGKPLRPFQQDMAASQKRVTLVKAGCGTGKTVGAYEWAKLNAEGRRLFFCYPTTGTASQGFIDYVNGTQIEADLMHSRADLDRELLFSGDSDGSEEDDPEGTDSRLVAFQAWRKKLIVCTVDTVLGLIQNNRKPLYAWAAIANATFVFDEVHSYDHRLFGALLKFLKTFQGAKILLMSASFTREQLQKIREVMAELGEELDEPIEGPKELEELPRYQIQWIPEATTPEDAPELWEPVMEALNQGQKILWVTNSVPSCINLYRAAKSRFTKQFPDIQPLIYHSRYRYRDRLKKHQAVVKAFASEEAVFAVTTQVCEMSLDLSADLLVCAIAPAAALIQRLGRLNRRMTCKEEGTRLALIYRNDQHPYSSEEFSTGEALIQQLSGRAAVSQADLAAILVHLTSRVEQEVHSRWLDDNWCTYPDALRQAGGTVTVLLQQDLGAIGEAANQREDKSFMREAQGWTVPIRIPKSLREWRRCRFYPIAPPEEITYCEETGAEPCKS
ncbi:CRISPR-associated helicase Cas3' [Coleofasciculus sp. H7-2]|uniref:CRISPR-associated helicase Cas3' n=1 Tax=Coleofasciculus sp. H7-2 TaxID=3351545 RepID=UPI00366D9739